MEALLYFLVKAIIAAYVLQKVWIFLFEGGASAMMWNKIPVRDVKTKVKVVPELPQRKVRKEEVKDASSALPDTVVGTTKVVILSDPKAATPQAVASEDLEPTGYIGQDKDISPDDIETDFNPEKVVIPSADELYDDPYASGYDPEMEGGAVSFEEINEAVEVLTATGEVDDDRKFRASGTLLKLRNTAILDIITGEVSTLSAVESLIGEFYSGDGAPIKGKVDRIEDIRMKEFDMSIYA